MEQVIVVKVRMLLILMIGLLFFLSHGPNAQALNCAEVEGAQEALKSSKGAVYGEVKQVKGDLRQDGFTGTKEYVRNILIDVEQSWKKTFDSQIIVATDYTWGFDFKEGHSYLIYLYEDEGSLASSPCIPTYEPRDLTEAQKLLGAGLPPGDEVNLNYKMWLMTDKDFDLYIAVGAVLLVVVLVVYWAKRVRKKK